MVWVSLISFTLIYAVLAVAWFYLIRRYVVAGPQEHDCEPAPPAPPTEDEVAPLSFALLSLPWERNSMGLQQFWFIAVAALFLGFFVLEGFDFGVGMLMEWLGRAGKGDVEQHRRAVLNTIGPVWDGNEVWLITAGGAMFAAFPGWYAAVPRGGQLDGGGPFAGVEQFDLHARPE